jgi:hypothetical protein
MERSLTVTCHLGMCNRLRVLLSGKIIAQATRRDLTMLWTPTVGCGCAFDQLFQNDWNVRSDILPEQYHWLDGTRLPLRAFPDLLASAEPQLAVEANGWMFRPTLYPAHVALEQQARELTCELTPLPSIAQEIETFREQNFRDTMIGVHLRRGDFLRWRPDAVGNLSATFQVVDRWLDRAPAAGILLCTDDGAPNPYKGRATSREETVAQFCSRYGTRVVTPKTTTLDRRELRAIQEGLRDLWLLRLTDFFAGTLGSSFSELATAGRAVPQVLTAEPTPRHAREMRWLSRLGLTPLLAKSSDSEFGKQLPYIHVLSRYLARIEFIGARWTKQMRRAK